MHTAAWLYRRALLQELSLNVSGTGEVCCLQVEPEGEKAEVESTARGALFCDESAADAAPQEAPESSARAAIVLQKPGLATAGCTTHLADFAVMQLVASGKPFAGESLLNHHTACRKCSSDMEQPPEVCKLFS